MRFYVVSHKSVLFRVTSWGAGLLCYYKQVNPFLQKEKKEGQKVDDEQMAVRTHLPHGSNVLWQIKMRGNSRSFKV